ncbi:MAG: fumarylacetoacetate hydrolase family protein [Bacteroidota bacterium]|nr:fumarylacetoacetate hydrolase family protein [Bacteroidota bacterium]
MQLIRFGAANKEKPGIYAEGAYYDASAVVQDYDEDFFADNGLEKLKAAFAGNKAAFTKLDTVERFGCPVHKPSKIVCIGLNYADHAKETGATPPAEPVIFFKATTALTGPNDAIVIPKNSTKTDWEVELAVVIGKRASYVEEAEAMDYVAGYCLHNDVSEREFQLERGGTWDKGKGCDTFAPIGPYLVTKEEIADVNNLRLWLKVNDQVMQDGNTSNLIFKIPFLISYLSQFMTLLPGDIISTGTPAGVGLGFKPEIYLKPGDVVTLGIDGLGSSSQLVKAYGHS